MLYRSPSHFKKENVMKKFAIAAAVIGLATVSLFAEERGIRDGGDGDRAPSGIERGSGAKHVNEMVDTKSIKAKADKADVEKKDNDSDKGDKASVGKKDTDGDKGKHAKHGKGDSKKGAAATAATTAAPATAPAAPAPAAAAPATAPAAPQAPATTAKSKENDNDKDNDKKLKKDNDKRDEHQFKHHKEGTPEERSDAKTDFR
jgi:translation initiation factor IF-2